MEQHPVTVTTSVDVPNAETLGEFTIEHTSHGVTINGVCKHNLPAPCNQCLCEPHHMRIAEADGTRDKLPGYCIRGCGYEKLYEAWTDPFLNLEQGDYAHELIFGYTRPGE